MDAIADDPEALAALGLITSHSFGGFYQTTWFEDFRSVAMDLLRQKRPELHSWVTSMSFHNMDAWAFSNYRHLIYGSKVNGIIPWACIQNPSTWGPRVTPIRERPSGLMGRVAIRLNPDIIIINSCAAQVSRELP